MSKAFVAILTGTDSELFELKLTIDVLKNLV